MRDKEEAFKINLDSSNVLQIDDLSRLQHHDVSHVKPNTTPSWLKEETGIRPGRVILTLRQY
jgi:hypothetical protein